VSTQPFSRTQGCFNQPPPATFAGWNLHLAAANLPEHLRRKMPDGSSLNLTDEVLLALDVAPTLIADGGFGLVHGPAGAGKSMVLGVIQAVCPHRVVHVLLEGPLNSKAFDDRIYRALTGTVMEGTESSIEDAIAVELSNAPTLLVVDEAQNVSPSTLLALRRFSDMSHAPFGVQLACLGSTKNLRRNTALWDRVLEPIELHPLSGAQLLSKLAGFHPLLADADPQLLFDIDDAHCRGSWRAWAQFINSHRRKIGPGMPLTKASAELTLRHNSKFNPGGLRP
jgi:hypothetical protein